jgi:Zn-dependent alcohol dehydrogenase
MDTEQDAALICVGRPSSRSTGQVFEDTEVKLSGAMPGGIAGRSQMTITSKAIIFTEGRKASPGDIELPEPSDGQMLVKAYCSGISIGTEGWIFTKCYKGTTFPCVAGYQKTGMVETIGAGVDSA